MDAVKPPPSSTGDLLAEPGRHKFLLFWGHRPQRDGSVGAGCLSQWWPAEFTVDGVSFRSAEHYMMWRTALLFGDQASGPAARSASCRPAASGNPARPAGPRRAVTLLGLPARGER